MSTNSTPTADNPILEAAIARGFTDVSVLTQRIVERGGVMDAGEWFLLSTKSHEDADWEFLGRRKTKGELVGLLDNAVARQKLSQN